MKRNQTKISVPYILFKGVAYLWVVLKEMDAAGSSSY